MKQLTALCATAFAAAALALSAGSAAAYPLEGGITAVQVAKVLQAKGFKADIGVDDDGDPRVKSAADGTNFTIFFYGCNGGPRCTSLTFQSGFHLDGGFTAQKINGWNHDKRFLKGWLDNTNDPYCEMDVDVAHGFTSEALGDYIDVWEAAIPGFKQYIGF